MNVPLGNYAMKALLFIGGLFLCWSIVTFLYQFIAALGSWPTILAAWRESRILSALSISLLSSFVTVFFSLLFGIPLAYLFAVRGIKGKSILETVTVDVPQTFPPVAEGIIYLLMLGPDSPFDLNLAFTFTALVIAKVYVSAPFIISTVSRQFTTVRQSGVDITARSLGASPFQIFLLIFLPMSAKSIAAGASLCWARAMGELGGSLIFAGVIAYKTEIIPTFIALHSSSQPMQALAASIIVTGASALSLLLFKRLTRH